MGYSKLAPNQSKDAASSSAEELDGRVNALNLVSLRFDSLVSQKKEKHNSLHGIARFVSLRFFFLYLLWKSQ